MCILYCKTYFIASCNSFSCPDMHLSMDPRLPWEWNTAVGGYIHEINTHAHAHAHSHAVPCRAVPCRAVPCRAVPCRAVPCRAVPCHSLRLSRSLFSNYIDPLPLPFPVPHSPYSPLFLHNLFHHSFIHPLVFFISHR